MEKISIKLPTLIGHNTWLLNARKPKTKEPLRGEVGRCGLYITVCAITSLVGECFTSVGYSSQVAPQRCLLRFTYRLQSYKIYFYIS